MYEIFEHTADFGLRIQAADETALFAEAGKALFSAIVANFDAVRPVDTVELRVAGDERDALLRDWLAELLFAFHTRRMVFSDFAVQFEPGGLRGLARGEPIDHARHELEVEIKAITWHGLKVERTPFGWLAEVIVDI